MLGFALLADVEVETRHSKEETREKDRGEGWEKMFLNSATLYNRTHTGCVDC